MTSARCRDSRQSELIDLLRNEIREIENKAGADDIAPHRL
jgi:hypothetical protein